MVALVSIYLFIIGACMGSFAGAMAWRMRKRKKLGRARSQCESCKHVLGARDLMPVVSWVVLRGKCRYCGASIGWSAIVLEVALGIAYVVSYLAWPFPLSTIAEWGLLTFWLLALVALAILFVYDARHFRLPDRVMYPLIVISIGFFALEQYVFGNTAPTIIIDFLTSLLPISGVYGFLYFLSGGKWVGFGDVKLGIALGLLTGWQLALLTVMLANFIGLLWVLPGLLTKQKKYTSRVPFGPFLIGGAFVAFLWGQHIIDWYFRLAGI